MKGKNMKNLSERNYMLISSGVKSYGSFDPDEIFPFFEEQLYCHEVNEIYDFLKWMHKNKKTFGSGNYKEVFKEYKKSKVN